VYPFGILAKKQGHHEFWQKILTTLNWIFNFGHHIWKTIFHGIYFHCPFYWRFLQIFCFNYFLSLLSLFLFYFTFSLSFLILSFFLIKLLTFFLSFLFPFNSWFCFFLLILFHFTFYVSFFPSFFNLFHI
jgi:hypothetical protein